ncbi:MAG: M16 family metallopeptidase [bacterium]
MERKTIYNRSVLDNGLTVVSEYIPYVRSLSIGVWIRTGSRNEIPDKNGISHFIEHMVFKGTTNRTAEEIARSLESVGGHLNAFTGKELTCYYARVLDEHMPLAMDVLADILANCLFQEEDIEREKQVVIEEIKNLDDTPDELIHDLFSRSLFEPHPLGWPTHGPAENVNRFSADDLRDFVSAQYTADRIVIAAAGNVIHADFVDLVTEHFHFSTLGQERATVDFPPSSTRIDVHTRRISQTHLCLGTRSYPYTHPHRVSLCVLSTLLGGGMSSRLFQKIRENLGLAYSIFTSLVFFADTGIFWAYVGTDSSHTKKVLRMVGQEFHNLASEPISDEELARTKSQLKGSLMLGLESTSARMTRLAEMEIYRNGYWSLDETLAEIDRVTAEEIREIAGDLFDPQKLTLTVLGPVKEGTITEEDLLVDKSASGKA